MANRRDAKWKLHRRNVRIKKRKQKRAQTRRTTRHDKATATLLVDEIRITAPKIFALEGEHHDRVAAFLAKLRNAVKVGDKVIRIDFRPTEAMASGATLLFYSELHRIRQLYPHVVIRCNPAKNEVPAEVLTHLKIYDMLGYDSAVTPTRGDVVSWQTASSNQIDGPKVGKTIGKFALNDLMSKHLFRGASEAMINAVNHAYAAERKDGLEPSTDKKWWMFLREDDGKLAVAVCDLGIGIPRSLPLKYPSEMVDKAMSVLTAGHRATDARLIQAAMELQRTRTTSRGRGRGLNDLRRIVDEVPGGQLFLFSNKGLVRYEAGVFTRKNFPASILGTVVVWIIPLGDQSNG